MMNQEQRAACRDRILAMLDAAGIATTAEEREQVEMAEFGLDEYEVTGLGIITYVNNDRYCAKELVMFPNQTCPEHRHPDVNGNRGKTETFRCRAGEVMLYVEGPETQPRRCAQPPAPDGAYTVFYEIVLKPGEQYTIDADTLHWFQAGPAGAVVSEFSSTSRDEADVFTDARIQRVPAG